MAHLLLANINLVLIMIKKTLAALSTLTALLLLSGCGQSIDTVDAGTYPGTIDKVVPEEREIYVDLDNGTRLELYFNETTELVRGGSPAEFSQLAQGGKVNVTVDREGNRNIPTRVEILQ